MIARHREHADDRLDAEIAEHLALLAADYERQGMAPADAALAARKAFGAVQRVQEAHRDLRGGRWWSEVHADVTYAVRGLIKAPVFAGVAVLTLALGIGANTAIFSIINGLFLRQLPVPEPEALVELAGVPPDMAALDALRTRRELFTHVAAHEPTQFNLGSGSDAEWVDGLWASAGFVELVGLPLAAGRAFSRDDDRPGGASQGAAAIISYRFWQRRFGGAASVIGTRLTVNRLPATIVGVTGDGFFGVSPGRTFDVMLPVALRQSMFSVELFGNDIGFTVARLRPGVQVEDAAALLQRSHARLREAMAQEGVDVAERMRYPLTVTPVGSREAPRHQSEYAQPLTILMGLVGFVLLIACANLANLLMARATARRQELAVRRALGASRPRLIRQLLVESGAIAVAGAGIGVLFAIWASRFLVALFAADAAFSTGRIMYGAAQLSVDLSLDWHVLGFTALVAVATVILFGAGPAIVGSSVTPMQAIKENTQNTPDRRPALWAGLVIAGQVAVSLVLLVGALLLGRTFTSVASVDPGFEPDAVITVDVDVARDLDGDDAMNVYRAGVDAVRALPGVAAAGLSDGTLSGGFHIGVATRDSSDVVGLRPTGTGWLRAIGADLLAGRDFTEGDRAGAPDVAIANVAFARRFFGGASPLGETVEIAEGEGAATARVTIVGLVGDMVPWARLGAEPQLYVPLYQMDPDRDVLGIALEEGGLSMSVRALTGSPMALRRSIGDALERTHAGLGLTFRSMRSEFDGLLTRERVLALLSGFFGVLGLLVAAIGLYGVTSYTVGRRQREIGIRLVLGARRRTVVGMVLSRTALLVAAGVATGSVASLWLSTFLVALLFGVEPQDLMTLAGAAATLLAVGALAAAVPAFRAARIDPADVLRTT